MALVAVVYSCHFYLDGASSPFIFRVVFHEIRHATDGRLTALINVNETKLFNRLIIFMHRCAVYARAFAHYITSGRCSTHANVIISILSFIFVARMASMRRFSFPFRFVSFFFLFWRSNSMRLRAYNNKLYYFWFPFGVSSSSAPIATQFFIYLLLLRLMFNVRPKHIFSRKYDEIYIWFDLIFFFAQIKPFITIFEVVGARPYLFGWKSEKNSHQTIFRLATPQ